MRAGAGHEYRTARQEPRPPATMGGAILSREHQKDGGVTGSVSGFRQKESQNDGRFPAANVLLIFPHGSAALDERLQAFIGVFQGHELVQIDILRSLKGVLKAQPFA